jgi:hypothetical protein
MPLELKNRISHRGRALQEARKAWLDLLAGDPASLPESMRRS